MQYDVILPTKDEIFEFILTALLREIGKDGKIDVSEKNAINRIFPVLQISPARFLELKEQIQKETIVDHFAGSVCYEAMFATIDNYLSENWDLHKGRRWLAKIAQTLEQAEALQAYLKDPEKYSEKEEETTFPNKFRI